MITRPSAGIVGRDRNGQVWAGNPRLAAQMDAAIDHPTLKALAADTQTVIYLGRESQVLGAVTIADQTRATSGPALAALRDGGVKQIVMMTGDRRPVALRIGEELGPFDEPDVVHQIGRDMIGNLELLLRWAGHVDPLSP